MITGDASGDFHALLARYFRAGEAPGPRLEAAGSIEAVKRSLATHPLALGVLPAYALADELGTGELCVLRPCPTCAHALCGAARRHAPSPAAARLIEVMRSRRPAPRSGAAPRRRDPRASG